MGLTKIQRTNEKSFKKEYTNEKNSGKNKKGKTENYHREKT